MISIKKKTMVFVVAGTAVVATAGTAYAFGHADFGVATQRNLASQSENLFGVSRPLASSSTISADPVAADADPTKLITVAKGLKVRTVAQVAGAPNIDQSVLWPNDVNPSHLISCNEQGTANVGLIAINIKSGISQTIVRSGLTSCDPVRRTAWGTILFGEEAGAPGRLFELVDPLHTSDVDITTSSTGSPNIVDRSGVLGTLSYEGSALYESGLMYFGDENRPGGGNIGGAYFKFVPTTPWNGTPITTASQLPTSPLAAGSVYGLQVGIRGTGDNGQGTETGLGKWVPAICPIGTTCSSLRDVANALKLTGYYRPEDAEIDHRALADGKVVWCNNNTGDESSSGGGHTWGNTICLSDGTLTEALANTAKPDVQLLLVGNPQFAMMDNIAQQPGSGNWFIHEDGDNIATGKNNDLWDCLQDGADDDTLSDGCIRIGSINDLGPAGSASAGEGAEWTGGLFDASGKTFYVSIQHNMTGKGTILAISGFDH